MSRHKKALYSSIFAVLWLLIAAAETIVTAQDSPQAFPPNVAAEIQGDMDDLTTRELPPGMVVWIDAPRYQFAGASGFADLKNNTPMLPEGAFRIGSITKMFTATVIIQLAEALAM